MEQALGLQHVALHPGLCLQGQRFAAHAPSTRGWFATQAPLTFAFATCAVLHAPVPTPGKTVLFPICCDWEPLKSQRARTLADLVVLELKLAICVCMGTGEDVQACQLPQSRPSGCEGCGEPSADSSHIECGTFPSLQGLEVPQCHEYCMINAEPNRGVC